MENRPTEWYSLLGKGMVESSEQIIEWRNRTGGLGVASLRLLQVCLFLTHSLTHLEAHAALALGLEHGLHLLLTLGGSLLRLLLGFLQMEERNKLLINTFVVCDSIPFQR